MARPPPARPPPPQPRRRPRWRRQRQRQPGRRGLPASPVSRAAKPTPHPLDLSPRPRPVPAARPGRPVEVPRKRPALSCPEATSSENSVYGRALSSASSHRRHPPSPVATQTLTIRTGYLKSLPEAWRVRELPGVSASHLHGTPSPSGTRYSSWGTGVRGGVEARLPQPAPRRCRRRRPRRCLERVRGWGGRSGEGGCGGRGEAVILPTPGSRPGTGPPPSVRPAPRFAPPSLARFLANGQLPPGPVTFHPPETRLRAGG